MVQRVQVGTDLELFQVVQARDIQRLRLGFAQAGQEQSSQDGDNRDDHQQFNQRKSEALHSILSVG